VIVKDPPDPLHLPLEGLIRRDVLLMGEDLQNTAQQLLVLLGVQGDI
jgi:hypothetical protein